ncbi:MAG: hypothetical protein US42_C0002G0080 [Candidatus Magasanikbacteria bacterium GW2011_GWC2_37_14]|uniref:Peptidase S11 D-alanyl-D-alanine carboxypeptidase A N-terminal domain-containing protein n=1 Tax=Candidatus Magasanikbacteria bacterium GW2011_GWC2_37_14 TaxID=1619046 RepID=A0A0G0GPQ5_9BACT|nr:MAG: hypothetical protein US42_C0002G0080 [Candidatus Magasanikbacteria bacterium GW2011_GWC2_37_14]
MKNLPHKLTISLLLVVFVLSYSPVFAVNEDNFNPNYLISDEEMQDHNSLTREEIQAFLTDNESFIANWKTEDKDGETRKASDIIYRAAQDYNINPKYLLVKLQKEQSLITNTSPTEKQLDGATGYGITDGCGWECASYLNNKGFGKQVDAAAGIIRWYYDHVDTEPWIRRANQTNIIDNQIIIPQNNATAFLYTYTPHIQGNKNFWKLWNQWFGQIYPNGTLIKGFNSSSVYLIQEGQKREITSMSVLQSRFDSKLIVTMPNTEIENLPTGPAITFANYSILKQGNNYYLVDFDTIRPFDSAETVRKIGYNPQEFIEVEKDDLNAYQIGKVITASILDNKNSPAGRIVNIKENNAYYYLKDNFYYPITDPQIAKINFPNLKIEKIAIGELQNFEMGEILKFKDGTIFGIKGDNRIYVMEDGKKRHIASEAVFNGFGYDWKNVIWTDTLTGMNNPTGQPLYLPTRLTLLDKIENKTTTPITNTIIKNKMVATPEDNTNFVGDKKFTTNVDTYLIADYDSEEILAGKNIKTVRPLASFTKIMTAYTLLQTGLQMTNSITYNPTIQKCTYSNLRTVKGEQFRNEHLFWSLMISSINTAAPMLVDSLNLTEKEFVAKMNKNASNWNLNNTFFVDSYGYDIKNVGTAEEFAKIFKVATLNTDLRAVMGMKSYEYNELTDKDGKPRHFDEHSNYLVNETDLAYKILASKTGYLDEAGAGLAMLVERNSDKKKFIIITMGNPNYNIRFTEPRKIAAWAMENF